MHPLVKAAEEAIAAYRAGKILCYEVYYFDAVNGDAGTSRVPVEALPEWLKEHPGHLIRKIERLWRLS